MSYKNFFDKIKNLNLTHDRKKRIDEKTEDLMKDVEKIQMVNAEKAMYEVLENTNL